MNWFRKLIETLLELLMEKFNKPKPKPEPEPEQPSVPVDAIDPRSVVWDEPAGDVGSWPVTAQITHASVTAKKIVVMRQPMDNWPWVQKPDWDKPSVGNWWAIALCDDGKFHAATTEWLGVGKTEMDTPKFDGGDDIHGPLGRWRPVSGEEFFLMQSTHARSGVIGDNCQRTQIVAVRWP